MCCMKYQSGDNFEAINEPDLIHILKEHLKQDATFQDDPGAEQLSFILYFPDKNNKHSATNGDHQQADTPPFSLRSQSHKIG